VQIVIVHCCHDRYSHEPYQYEGIRVEGDYSVESLEKFKKDYVAAFQGKRLSRIGIVHMNVSPDGVVTIIDNIQGKNEVKSRREINPAAVAAKASRHAALRAKMAPPIPNMWAVPPATENDFVASWAAQTNATTPEVNF